MDMDSDIQTTNNKIDTAIPRQLVLDYLLHNCYGETARAFMKDDLDAVKDVSDLRKGSLASSKKDNKTRNGNSNGHGKASHHHHHHHNAHRNGSDHAQSHIQGGLMTRNASDESLRRTGSDAGTMMETEDDDQDEHRLDHEGDSPMGESYSDSKEPVLTAGTFTADKAHALHIDEQLKNLETRKAIRSLISHGDIEPAMVLCNSAFPGVLSVDPNSPLTVPASIHMNFKLQCQKFIEMVKADPGPEALMFAQQVVADFTRLDPEGNDHYETHMAEALSVIAYPKPEEAPHGHLMKQEARDHLADIMNSAVLGCNGMSCEPALLTIVKQATLVRDQLMIDNTKVKRGIKAPTRWKLSTFLEETS